MSSPFETHDTKQLRFEPVDNTACDLYVISWYGDVIGIIEEQTDSDYMFSTGPWQGRYQQHELEQVVNKLKELNE